MASNRALGLAKRNKKDEFYTQLSDIENELRHYKSHFKNKVVFCNCDDPRVSNFFKYFVLNFEHLGLKKVIATCYKNQNADLFSQHKCEKAVYLTITPPLLKKLKLEHGGELTVDSFKDIKALPLEGNGDFRSLECIELLKQSDIVCTNPPFSLFREYVAQLVKYNKKFLIIGNQNAITYKDIFSLIQSNKLWLGSALSYIAFKVPDYYEEKSTRFWIDENGQKWRSLGNACWFTNLDYAKRHESLILYRKYNPEEYPKYVNYDAIEVAKTKDIPVDYDGLMGVPITFLDKYCPEQFQILGISLEQAVPMTTVAPNGIYQKGGPAFYLPDTEENHYKRLYCRIIIKRKQQ